MKITEVNSWTGYSYGQKLIEANGNGDILMAFVFSSFSSTKPLKWPVSTFFFKLHVPALFLSLSLSLLSFLFFFLLLFLLLWCTFPHIFTQTRMSFLTCCGLVEGSLGVSDELGLKQEENKVMWFWKYAT